LVLCAVLSNVVLLNFAFDVPVKLFSANLLLMAVFLAAPDAKRLINVLVLNRAAAPRPISSLFNTKRLHQAGIVLRSLFAAFVMWSAVTRGLGYYRQSIGPNAPKSPLYGIWDVEELTKNDALQPPLLSDSLRWKRIVFGGLSRATVRSMSDSVERYTFKVDSTRREVTLTGRLDPKLVRTLSYTRADPDHLVLGGRVNGDSLVARLRRVDEKRFLLVSRGYNWIQELPFNR
jgi:hypothetical protein